MINITNNKHKDWKLNLMLEQDSLLGLTFYKYVMSIYIIKECMNALLKQLMTYVITLQSIRWHTFAHDTTAIK